MEEKDYNEVKELNLESLDLNNFSPIGQDNDVVNSSATNSTEGIEDDYSESCIQIGDKKSPIILLFGPTSCGKSMTLVRLSRYLRDQGYEIVPDYNFRIGDNYRKKCDKFLKDLDTQDALRGTSYGDFLLVKIVKNGKTICQFLEAPGEHYFEEKNVSANNFPAYMTRMIRAQKNRKIWVFITEANWNKDFRTKKAYVARIANCNSQIMTPSDRCIIMYNKIDQKPHLKKSGKILISQANEEMSNEYEGLVKIFKNYTPFVSWIKPFKYEFVPFCTGYYNEEAGRVIYTESEDMYPRYLWHSIMKSIKG